jgi:hypothetical protein
MVVGHYYGGKTKALPLICQTAVDGDHHGGHLDAYRRLGS